MFVAFIIQIVFRYLLNLPIGWTQELTRHPVDLAGAVRRRLRRPRERGDPLRPHLRDGERRRRAASCASSPRIALIALYGVSLPAVVDYVTFMKVESTRLSQDPLRLLFSIYVVFAVAVDRPLPLAVLARDLGQGAGRLRSDQGGLGRMNLASPFSIAIVVITVARAPRPADRPRDDRRLDPLSAAGRAGHGHGRRAAAERHVHQLHHPRGAAVHPRGRADERRLA